MRELKFRVWGITEKEYIRYPFAWLSIFDSPDGLEIEDNEDLVIEQYTGLKDKNGKEIYEGDIVRYAFKYPEGEWVEEVSFGKISDGEGYYHDYFLAWRTTDKDGDGHQSLLDLEGYCEVIGNVHENKELLGEEDE